ncbi:MAG: FprA family A-type flavoprotein [Deltaproteobacteria bacterium]|nr:FprA family A-type flavoprotein [Deltaproteobacteria bacterium]
MSETPFQAIRVTDRVYWVGAIDWSLRDFHGYLTSRGTTYNAYLVVADKVTLVDTVKRPFLDEMLSRIASVVDISRIDTVVSLHAEMDHSGCLPELIEVARPSKVLTSKAGVGVLDAHYQLRAPVEAVVNGAEVNLGGARFVFHETRMLHWPESMFCWLPDDQVLMSQDAFGMHLASQERFVDQVPTDATSYETAKYFANILMPYSDLMGRMLVKLGDTVKQTKVIATDHGPIWREGIEDLLKRYETWCARRPSRKLVIAYDTMWQSTAAMASAIAEGASSAGVRVAVMKLGLAHRSDIATELLDAGGLLVGSPNLNGQMFPTVADLLTYLKSLKPKGLVGGAFGSYGWNAGVAEQVSETLKELKVESVGEPLSVKFVPRDEHLGKCRAFGELTARKIIEVAGG